MNCLSELQFWISPTARDRIKFVIAQYREAGFDAALCAISWTTMKSMAGEPYQKIIVSAVCSFGEHLVPEDQRIIADGICCTFYFPDEMSAFFHKRTLDWAPPDDWFLREQSGERLMPRLKRPRSKPELPVPMHHITAPPANDDTQPSAG